MMLIVGLGNPGRRYGNTPHNIGFDVVDELANRCGLKWLKSRRVDAEVAEGEIASKLCLLVKPTTYMNTSGNAVAPLVRGKYLDASKQLLTIVDDIALPLGRLRIKATGSSGGHRGLDSLIERLGTRSFPRLRCGVGPGPATGIEGDLADFVLAKWHRRDKGAVDTMCLRAADAVEDWLSEDLDAVMCRYNREA